MLHSVSGDCDACDSCGGDLYYDSDSKEELCSDCCDGHEKLKKLGVETKVNKNIK